MGNLTGKTEKRGTLGAFNKAGNVDTICIFFGDVDPTAEKLYRSDHIDFVIMIIPVQRVQYYIITVQI